MKAHLELVIQTILYLALSTRQQVYSTNLSTSPSCPALWNLCSCKCGRFCICPVFASKSIPPTSVHRHLAQLSGFSVAANVDDFSHQPVLPEQPQVLSLSFLFKNSIMKITYLFSYFLRHIHLFKLYFYRPYWILAISTMCQ